MSKSGLGKFIVGAGIGIGIGLLLAAKPGKETREDIKKKFKELEDKFKSLDYTELKEEAITKLDDLKLKIKDLDQEEVAEIAKEKIVDIKDGLVSLTKTVKRKSAPVIKKAVSELSSKLDDLENSLEEK